MNKGMLRARPTKRYKNLLIQMTLNRLVPTWTESVSLSVSTRGW